MQEAFDLLRRLGLSTPEEIDHQILGDYPLSKVVDLDSEIGEVVDRHSHTGERKAPAITEFDLLPNGDMSAGMSGACWHEECRLRNLDALSRFALMWADTLYLPPYFGVNRQQSPLPREWVAGSLKALLQLEPAIRAGVIHILPPVFHFCDEHGQEFERERARAEEVLTTATQAVHDAYAERVRLHISATPRPQYCYVSVEGPDDLFPHGSLGWVAELSDIDLPQSLKRKISAGGRSRHELSKDAISRSGLLDHAIGRIASEVLGNHLVCRSQGTKYITNRKADIVFLNAINDNDAFAAWNLVLAQHLSYEMPILNGVPLEDLIDLRTHDYEAFQVYRDTMKDIIGDHIANRPAITGTEAKDIYNDKVRPQLNKMNLKLRSVRDKLSSKLRRDLIIASGAVVLGLSSGLVLPPLALSAAAAVPFAVSAAKSTLERGDASDELKSDNLYFLWKVAEKSRQNLLLHLEPLTPSDNPR